MKFYNQRPRFWPLWFKVFSSVVQFLKSTQLFSHPWNILFCCRFFEKRLLFIRRCWLACQNIQANEILTCHKISGHWCSGKNKLECFFTMTFKKDFFIIRCWLVCHNIQANGILTCHKISGHLCCGKNKLECYFVMTFKKDFFIIRCWLSCQNIQANWILTCYNNFWSLVLW